MNRAVVFLLPLAAVVSACDDGFCVSVDDRTICLDDLYPEEPLVFGGEGAFDPSVGSYAGDPCGDFQRVTFDFAEDELSCRGPQFMRFDDRYGLFVGAVSCGGGAVRLYLSDNVDGPFLPATDTAGHGQDQCELVHPGFALGNEDDIASGNCPECTTSMNLPLEDVDTWTRANLGEPFALEHSGEWSWQTSQLGCGVNLDACVDNSVSNADDDIWLPSESALPPSEGVPCETGGSAWMSHPISGDDMSSGASDDSGDGFCVSLVVFGDDIEDSAGHGANGMTQYCDAVHCGTVLYGSGRTDTRLCTAFARCEDGIAHTTGYTW